jgi:GNAT superfamily N-acetyltransferase
MIDVSVTIRTATPTDAPRLDDLHAASVRALCAGHYSPEIIDGWLLDRTPDGYLPPIGRGAIFVAELSGEIVGFGETAPGTVVAIYVDPARTRRGVGRCLLLRALDRARDDGSASVVVESTLNASPFYQQHGFREVRRETVTRNQVQVPIVVMVHGAETVLSTGTRRLT